MNDSITPSENARLAVEFERWPDARRLWRILMLSPTIEIAEALLKGQTVPIESLDPEWVKRFGFK
jgi:hypothetical protein